MTIERAIRILAGTFVLTSVGLSYLTGNHHWLWLAVFVGVNLIQSSFTGFCPAEKIFRAAGMKASGE